MVLYPQGGLESLVSTGSAPRQSISINQSSPLFLATALTIPFLSRWHQLTTLSSDNRLYVSIASFCLQQMVHYRYYWNSISCIKMGIPLKSLTEPLIACSFLDNVTVIISDIKITRSLLHHQEYRRRILCRTLGDMFAGNSESLELLFSLTQWLVILLGEQPIESVPSCYLQ